MIARLLTIPPLLAMGLAASPATGQLTIPTCGSETEALRFFEKQFGEVPVSQEEVLEGEAVVVRVENPQTGAYSILIILRGKHSCVVDAGQEGRS